MQIYVPRVMVMSKKKWDLYLTRGHFFDCEGHFFEIDGHLFNKEVHLFWEGSKFCYQLLGGRDFDHVYKPLRMIHKLENNLRKELKTCK